MDKTSIKKFATWARRELIDRVRHQAYRFEVESAEADMDITAARGIVLSPEQRTQRQALIARMKAKGYDATIEEVAYTWFDRFCALRFMEVNGYLPDRTRMFSDSTGAFHPQILTDALNVELSGLDIDTVIQLKESNQTEALFKYLLLTMCNALKPVLTLFQPDDRGCSAFANDYTWLLLPENLLREGSVPEQMVQMIPEKDWKDAVQIVGWLYQYYNAEPKDQVFANLKKNIKISKKDIPAATQLFTPDWIVRYMVENSLGRLWVEGHPDDGLKANWKYYLEEAEQEPEVQAQLAKIRERYAQIKPEEILCTDCCSGSGHILVYMFEVLVQLYEAYGYPTRDAVASIVKNNLWGMDIDDRAAQLANFAVMMVARRYDKGWFRRGLQPHVMAIQESNSINRDHLCFLGHGMDEAERQRTLDDLNELLNIFIDAKEYGSILQPKAYDWDALRRFVRMTEPEQQITFANNGVEATQERLMQIIEQGQALAQKYHVAVTNPPYMGSSGMDNDLAKYVKSNYPDSKSDLFSVFIERIRDMLATNGYQAMITQHVWMFLSSFEKLRGKLMQVDTVNMAHLGARAFEEIGGEVVQTTAFVLQNAHVPGYKGTYCRLIEPTTQQGKEDMFLAGENRYVAQGDNYANIPGKPVAYWVSEEFAETFKKKTIRDTAIACIGMRTGDNDRFLRLWYEVPFKRIGFHRDSAADARSHGDKWIPYNKGGEYRKWYGNHDYVVNWENDGFEIKENTRRVYPQLGENLGWKISNEQYYFQEGISWTVVTSKVCFRRYDPGCIFSNSGQSVLSADAQKLDYLVGLLNSKYAERVLQMISPTLGFESGYVNKVPVIICVDKYEEVISTVKQCVIISRADWDSFETSWDFQSHPFIRIDRAYAMDDGAYHVAATAHYYGEGPEVSCPVEACFLLWKKECNERFNQLKQNEEALNRIFIDIYGLQDELTPEVADKDVTVRKADLGRDIRSLISYAIGCMMGRFALDKPGLQFAGGDWEAHMQGIRAERLAANEKDAELKAILSLPPDQYELLFPDHDGILPITDDEYFSDDIVTLFVEWLKKAFGAEMLEENLKYIAWALYPSGSGTARELIRQYFLNDFYKDHLKIYQKRPIYWLFDSGKKNGVKCLVYMHRWQRDTVARVRTDYVHEMQSRYRTTIEDLSHRVDTVTGSERVHLQKQLAKVQAQDAELLKYEEKVHHLADQMIDIDLDDGVKHNYALFQDILAPLK